VADQQEHSGSGPPERITEIGRWESIDTGRHTLAAALSLAGLIAVFVVGLVALGVAVSDGDRRVDVPDVVVPSIEGASEDSARATLESVGLLMEVSESPNELVPDGVVFEQVPIDGARLEIGSSVTARVSTGPAGTVVPELVGQQVTEAQALLVATGLTGVQVPEFDEEVRIGEVLGSEPAAGRRAPPDGVVSLVVSDGPAPRVVPEVDGRDDLDVLAELGRLRLRPGDIEYVNDSDLPDGTVLSISPAPGASVPRDSEVDLVIAGRAPLVAVPSVLGLLRSTAEEALSGSGIRATYRTVALPVGDSRNGRVVRQGVQPAEEVPSGTVVEILIGSAPPPPTTTTTTTVPASSTTTTSP